MKDYRNLDKIVAGLRREYSFGKLEEGELCKNPFEQFSRWLEDAVRRRVPHLDTMALATATPKGKPSVRVVLLKGFDRRGFVFYTHYDSRKGREIKMNPRAEMVFFWGPFERQVRIAGRLAKVSALESDLYFATRPRASQIGAWASHQSRPIKSRREIERRVREIEQKFRGRKIPRPPFWGGYCLQPEAFEFWQGRKSRLNDRFLYRSTRVADWTMTRLQP